MIATEWHSRHASVSPVDTVSRATIEADSPGHVEVEAIVTVETSVADSDPILTVVVPETFFFNAAPVPDVTRVALQRSAIRPAHERGLWTLIRANTRAIGFHHYHEFISRVLCNNSKDDGAETSRPLEAPASGSSASTEN